MIVRPASFRDLSRIEQLYREAFEGGVHQIGQLHSDHPVPQASTLLRLWYAVSKTLTSLMPLTDSGDLLFVAEHPQEGVAGFVQAQPAPGKPRAWQIVNLCTSSTPIGQLAAEQLLQGLCRHGQEEADVQRFYVRLPLGHPLLTEFIQQGFQQYATEQILFIDSDAEIDEGAIAAPRNLKFTPGTVPLRTAKRDDIGAINLLYLRVTPATVAAIEAPNRKTWESTFAAGSIARLGRDDVHHVVAENPGIYAWAAIRAASSARPTVLHLMCEAQNSGDREAFLDALLAQLPEGPVSSVLRHYDSELIRSLQQRGFAVFGTQVLLTKDLAVRIEARAPSRQRRKKPALVPAGLAQSVPTPRSAHSQLHVIHSVAQRGPGRSETSPSR